MFTAIAAGIASPLRSSHILWINLITDSLPALALGIDRNDGARLMKRPPRKSGESLFAGGGWFLTLFYGLLIAALTLSAFLMVPLRSLSVSGASSFQLLKTQGLSPFLKLLEQTLLQEAVRRQAQTYAFTVLGLSELFHAIGMRNVGCSLFSSGWTRNPLMAVSFFTGLLLQVAVTEIPFLIRAFETVRLSASEWGLLMLLSAVPLLAHELLLGLKKL